MESIDRHAEFVLPEQMNPSKGLPLRRHVVLNTRSLSESQSLTSHIWSKHESRVVGRGSFDSKIARVPLGRCWLCHVDCRAPVQVSAEGNTSKIIVYLPIQGSMRISVGGEKLTAVPGGPVLIPPATPTKFRATPIHCILLEIPASKLRSELAAQGWTGTSISPLAWKPDGEDSTGISDAIHFVLNHLGPDGEAGGSPVMQRRLESLVVSFVANAVATRQGPLHPVPKKIGRVRLDTMKKRITGSLESDCSNAELASFAGLTTRALQKQFLKFFHTTPSAFVQNQRLVAANKSLRDPKNKKSVTRLASDLGFHHLGRFSSVYRKKFGESPSETLARSSREARK